MLIVDVRRSILTRQDGERLRRALDKRGGDASVRWLRDNSGIAEWIVEAAERAGWVRTYVLKPQVGRPSKWVKLMSLRDAKVLPDRASVEPGFSFRHLEFALQSVVSAVPYGASWKGEKLRGCLADAYQNVYRRCSRKSAYAAASRLVKRRDVNAMRQWWYAKINCEIPDGQAMPDCVSEIHRQLKEAGSPRARFVHARG